MQKPIMTCQAGEWFSVLELPWPAWPPKITCSRHPLRVEMLML